MRPFTLFCAVAWLALTGAATRTEAGWCCGAAGYSCCPVASCAPSSCYTACCVERETRVGTVYETVWEPEQVTCERTVYDTVCEDVEQTCYRTVVEPRKRLCRTYTCEPVWTTHCIKVQTGCWQEEKQFCPGPVVHRTCRQPGTWTFDPCTCTCRYCPGPVVTYAVQCPGRWVCRRVWVPREEVRTVRCCRYVLKEHCHEVTEHCCRLVPYTVTRQIPYTTCRMVPEQHVRHTVRRYCENVPEVRVRHVPYTTCRLVPEERCQTVRQCRVRYECEQRCRYETRVTCKTVPVQSCQLVARQVCSMEPYTVTRCVTRYVPVCVPVCQ